MMWWWRTFIWQIEYINPSLITIKVWYSRHCWILVKCYVGVNMIGTTFTQGECVFDTSWCYQLICCSSQICAWLEESNQGICFGSCMWKRTSVGWTLEHVLGRNTQGTAMTWTLLVAVFYHDCSVGVLNGISRLLLWEIENCGPLKFPYVVSRFWKAGLWSWEQGVGISREDKSCRRHHWRFHTDKLHCSVQRCMPFHCHSKFDDFIELFKRFSECLFGWVYLQQIMYNFRPMIDTANVTGTIPLVPLDIDRLHLRLPDKVEGPWVDLC